MKPELKRMRRTDSPVQVRSWSQRRSGTRNWTRYSLALLMAEMVKSMAKLMAAMLTPRRARKTQSSPSLARVLAQTCPHSWLALSDQGLLIQLLSPPGRKLAERFQ